MRIHLTPEQERRLRAVLDRGAYKYVEEVVEAALTAVEQRAEPALAAFRTNLGQKAVFCALFLCVATVSL